MHKLPVLYPDRTLAFMAQEFEVRRLLDFGCIRLESNTRGTVKAAVMRCKLEFARKLLRQPKEVRTHGGVTRMKQDPGAARWVQRADMAGRGAGSLPAQTIHFKLGHRECTA